MKQMNFLIGLLMLSAVSLSSGCSHFIDEEPPKDCHLQSSQADKNAKLYDCKTGPGVIRYEGYYE
ncbi:hypothetical protein [Thiomicrorhabdus heinhorstiae]|uniref:Lipoprotein n=1 Tax=Thiomicrorhabdus heinhorstiae TaxID=2748010 RepID=A0ABS0BX06_9GAMM|nr:hypothetical protein [Thiomicrorhabdus heinhorstiae]MBF6058338.1 hypothetical protein [Thiomicrorhabdus heinhorstiae]